MLPVSRGLVERAGLSPVGWSVGRIQPDLGKTNASAGILIGYDMWPNFMVKVVLKGCFLTALLRKITVSLMLGWVTQYRTAVNIYCGLLRSVLNSLQLVFRLQSLTRLEAFALHTYVLQTFTQRVQVPICHILNPKLTTTEALERQSMSCVRMCHIQSHRPSGKGTQIQCIYPKPLVTSPS